MYEIFEGKLLITVEELSKALNISAHSIYNQISAGTFPIPVRRVGRLVRFDVRDVEEYLASI